MLFGDISSIIKMLLYVSRTQLDEVGTVIHAENSPGEIGSSCMGAGPFL